MPIPSMTSACPECQGNLHYDMTEPHPERKGYDIHTYRCISCGPMIRVTQFSDEWFIRVHAQTEKEDSHIPGCDAC